MRGACAMIVAIGCAATADPRVLRNAGGPPETALAVRFDQTTIAFHMHVMPSPNDLPTRLDDRDCPAVASARPDAEDAVFRAFDAARRSDRHHPFDWWRARERVRTEHAVSARWLDAHTAISRRRHRGDPAMDLAARIGDRGGYLVVWGQPSVVFCFDATLVPRIIEWVDS